jgi:hypothetical protein
MKDLSVYFKSNGKFPTESPLARSEQSRKIEYFKSKLKKMPKPLEKSEDPEVRCFRKTEPNYSLD